MTANRTLLFAAVALIVTMAVGCNPVGESDTAEANVAFAETDASAGRHQRMAKVLADFGIDVNESAGIFGVGWRERPRAEGEDSQLRSHARAVALGEAAEEGFRPGIDMGNVVLRAPDSEIELSKKERRRGGIVYGTMGNREAHEPPPSIAFVGNGVYEFEASGSGDFAAVTLAVTAPAELIHITSHSRGDAVSGAEDLIIEWHGGGDGKIAVGIAALGERPAGRHDGQGPHGRGQGGRGGHGGREGHGGRGGPPRPENVVREMLDSNPGQHTITAGMIAELIGDSDATRIGVRISQVVASNVERDADTFWVVLHTGDGVLLELE